MQSLKWLIGSKIQLKWTVPWFSVFVDQTNLKIIWRFRLSQYRCHKTPIDVENCVKSALNSNHRKQNFTVITNWVAHLPQNRFRWRWLLFEELWTPSLMHSMIESFFCLFVYNSWTRNMVIMDAGAACAHKLMVVNKPRRSWSRTHPRVEFFWKNHSKSRFSWDPVGPRTTTFIENENHFLSSSLYSRLRSRT